MEALYPRCCGLDIHQKAVRACLMTTEAGMAGPFDGGRPARLDALAGGPRESVRDIHAGHERVIATGTGRVTVEATWPKFRPSLPRDLTLAKTVLAECELASSASLPRFSWAPRGS